MLYINKIFHSDCLTGLKHLPNGVVNTCVTSPPYYGLRDYGVNGQVGLEETPEGFVQKLVEIFREVKRVLKDDGTVWLNLGDSYAGSGKGGQSEEKRSENWHPEYGNKVKRYGLKPKDLIGIPWMVAFALRADGWYLRQDIIWHKPNPMPESVTDRCTKAHEYIFLLSKSQKYYFDSQAISEPANYDGRKDTQFKGGVKYEGFNQQTMLSRGHERWKQDENGNHIRNKRSVWTVTTKPFKEAHFATFPEKLIQPCILAGCPENGLVLDPFMGAPHFRQGQNLCHDWRDAALDQHGEERGEIIAEPIGVFPAHRADGIEGRRVAIRQPIPERELDDIHRDGPAAPEHLVLEAEGHEHAARLERME